MVVALDADRRGDPVADIDHAGVLARADEHPGGLRRQTSQVPARRLVGTVLRPHHRIHGQLEPVGRTAEDGLDVGGFVVGEAQRLVHSGHLSDGSAERLPSRRSLSTWIASFLPRFLQSATIRPLT